MKAFLATCAVAFATAACGPVFAAGAASPYALAPGLQSLGFQVPAGFTLAPNVGATVGAGGIGAGSLGYNLPSMGGGQGIQLGAPNLTSMGGGPVFAAEYAAENNAGGHLVLTEEPCPVDGAPANVRGAFTYSATGDLALGCWTLAGDRVLVIWLDDGTAIEYAASLFRKVDGNLGAVRGERGA